MTTLKQYKDQLRHSNEFEPTKMYYQGRELKMHGDIPEPTFMGNYDFCYQLNDVGNDGEWVTVDDVDYIWNNSKWRKIIDQSNPSISTFNLSPMLTLSEDPTSIISASTLNEIEDEYIESFEREINEIISPGKSWKSILKKIAYTVFIILDIVGAYQLFGGI